MILHFLGPAEAVQPGDNIEIRFSARDAFGVKSATLNVHGAFEATVSGEFEGVPKELEAYTVVHVPDGSSIEEPAIATLTVADAAGHEAHGETRIYLRDTRPPFGRLDFGGLHYDETIRPGETLDIYVNAEDNHRLRFIGYEGAGLRDSVAATSIGDSHTFRLIVPQSWLMQRPFLKAWARDVSGNVSQNFENSTRQVPVYNWVDHAVTTTLIQRDPVPMRVLWDAKRSAVYRLRADPEGENTSRIDGVDVSASAPVRPIALPMLPWDFTWSVTGDSLVVTFLGQRTLGIVDLLPPVRSTTTVPLRYDGEIERIPSVAHASGGRFFVALVNGLYWRLLEVNFGTGAQVIRTDIDGGADVAWNPSLLRLPDGRLVIGPERETGYVQPRVIYSPTSDTFTPTFRLRAVTPRQYSASPSGRFMMGNTIYGAALDSVANVITQDWSNEYANAAAAALSPDGLSVYLSTRYGYQKVRLSDGFLLEQVKLEMTPLYLFAVADGSRLIAVGESSVMVIDLR